MPTIPLSAGIKMTEGSEKQVAVIPKQKRPVRKYLCSILISVAVAVIAILAICAGVFLGAIACVWTITDKIIRILDAEKK